MILPLLLTLAQGADDGAVIIDLGGEVSDADAAGQARFSPLPTRGVTLDLVEADLAGVLRIMARTGDLNIVLADGVSGNVTVQVRDRPWDEVLLMVVHAAGVQATRIGDDILLIEPKGS
ncbi:MAG: hypothetical protein H6741_23785 [Alphaproteobacteria bacterium]|nr:hypothetical protein [Alphaproteobacteria bacterium]